MAKLLRVFSICLLVGCISACAGVREHVRQYDFRTMRRAAAREKAVPSPIADVLDMNGWTSDFDGATAFARVNHQRTIVFFYGPTSASAKAKSLVEKSVARISDVQKVALNIEKKRGIAARLGVDRVPAIVVLDASGRVVAREEGAITQDTIASALAQ
ncbi:MAG: thioredoxin family protein [Candidatus Sumerlaeaceae bacterium]|nr:thioredoxin family protein [Candidatus Sumerlaeaceae bacterium]